MTDAIPPKVSVVMPVYNGALYVERAIGSLLEQSFQNWELIVIDDGSTDETPQILERFTDPRVRVIRQPNGGEAAARNTGLNNLRGEYLAFLDADDIYLSGALEQLSAFLDQNPRYGVVFSDGYICDQEDRRLMRLTEVRPGIYTGWILDALVITPSVVTVPVCTMTRVTSIQEHQLRFDEKNNLIGTDWDFWTRLAVHVEYGYLGQLTCQYRIHTSNLTRMTGSEKRKRDHVYRRMKILNSDWFQELYLDTKRLFFLDLLTGAYSGEAEPQLEILRNEKFMALPGYMRAFLWRAVGIDSLQNQPDLKHARLCFQEALKAQPGNWKTRLLLASLGLGRPVVLMFVKFWRLILEKLKRTHYRESSQAVQLQKMLGVQ